MTEPTYTSTDTPVRTDPSGRPARDDDLSPSREFENFKDLAGKLFQVPGREVKGGEG